MRRCAGVLLCIVCVGGFAQIPGAAPDLRHPSDQLLLAAADIAKVPKDVAVYVRYVDLGNFPPAEREDAIRVMFGHFQHLSRSSEIINPAIVLGSKGSLLRVNLYDYGISTKVWEQLLDIEPYYHVPAKLVKQTVAKIPVIVKEAYEWKGGKGQDGLYYPPGTYYRDVKTFKDEILDQKVSDQIVSGPWVTPTPKHQSALALLVAATETAVPIVRADWLFNQSAAQVDRKPGYYDFLGVKDQKDFEKLIGFNQKLFDGFSVELRASVADSGVTLQPRAIARFMGLGGGYWKTFDFKQAVKNNNPLAILDRSIEHDFDATEQFGLLPNGFWATGLFDNKGKRVDTAPDFVASDSFSKSNDKRVHVNVSCIRCHSNGGLKDFDDWTRNLLTPPPDFVIQGKDYDQIKIFRQQYLKKLSPFLVKDRLVFEDAVKEATGWDSKKYAQKYGEFWSRFEDKKVTLASAALDLGVSQGTLKKALQGSIKVGQGDLVLSALLKTNGTIVPVRQWLEKIPDVYLMIETFAKDEVKYKK